MANEMIIEIILGVLGAVGTLASVVAWVFVTFDQKKDAKERHQELVDRNSRLESRVSHGEGLIGKVASDVSYIRGRMEPK